ncbi:MAG: hypothetical protein L0241_02325 [Planctomycetia bacterium]|nr:hypothetical protein [Planctomycetia bacterium]
MFRKLMLGAVVAVAVGLSAQSAMAGPPVKVQPSTGGFYLPPSYPGYPQYPTFPSYPRPFPPQYPSYPQPRHDHDYVVYVRHGDHWDRYGRYETLREAERVEWLLERRGLRARIEVVHNRRW